MAPEGPAKTKMGTWGQLLESWPVIVAVALCGAMLVTTQTTLGYVARDVAELKADFKAMGGVMSDRWTEADHDKFIRDRFKPLEDELRRMQRELSQHDHI